MTRKLLSAFAIIAAVATLTMAPAPASAGEMTAHKVTIHVDENDPKRMNLALNNAENMTKYYQSKGEVVEIEIVTYGPGLHMLRAGTSPVASHIAIMSMEYENLSFAACGVTRGKMEEKEGKKIEILPEAKMVPSGVVRLVELQEKGYAYVRP